MLWLMETMQLVYEVHRRTGPGGAPRNPRGMHSARGYELLYTDDPAGPYEYSDQRCYEP